MKTPPRTWPSLALIALSVALATACSPVRAGTAPSEEADTLGAGPRFPVDGRVVGADGRPRAGVTVWAEATDLRAPTNNALDYEHTLRATRTTTDAAGRFRLSLPDGAWTLTASGKGLLPLRTPVALRPDGAVTVDLVAVPDEGPAAIAHRGASGYAPENTLSAVRKAALVGARTVEVDVQLTRDDVLVLMHDFVVDRTTDGRGAVRDLTAAELGRLDAGVRFDATFAGERVPTFADALDLARTLGVDLIVDIKARPAWATATWNAVIHAIRAAGAQKRAVFATFDRAGVELCAAAGGLRCALLVGDAETGLEAVARAHAAGASLLLLRSALADADAVAAAHDAGLSVYAWTVNDPPTWQHLLRVGVDGVVTDRPGTFSDFRARHATGRVADPPGT